MDAKRGQISIFVLISLVVLIAIFFVFYLKTLETGNAQKENSKDIPISYDSINLFVNLCLKDIAEKGIRTIGLQGGYYYNDSLSQGNNTIRIPYYWYQQENIMPSKETIQSELSSYIKDKLNECLKDFNNFKNQGYSFKTGKIKINSFITERNLVVNLDYPIEAKISGKTLNMEKFTAIIDFDLNKKYSLVKEFMQEQAKIPDIVPLGHLSGLAYLNNFTFTITYVNHDSVLYLLIFNDTQKEPFLYTFMANYNWSATQTAN